eukprot:8383784-Heterocapsa_arctica.AAC.1
MDLRWKGAITRHKGFRTYGRPKRCENTTTETQPQGPGAPGAPPEAAPLWFLFWFRIVWAGHVLEISYGVLLRPLIWHAAIY